MESSTSGCVLIGDTWFRLMKLEQYEDVSVSEHTPNRNGYWIPGGTDVEIYFSVVMYCNMQRDLFNEEEE